jgi:hypothetical protein
LSRESNFFTAGLVLVVLVCQLERAAEDAPGGVDLLEGEDHAVMRGLAEAGFLAGEGGVLAQLDGFGGPEAGRQAEDGEGGECGEQGGDFHGETVLGWVQGTTSWTKA